MSGLRIVRAEGDSGARGQQIGRELRELINESVDFYHRYLSRRGVSSRELQDLLTPYLVAAESQFPAYMSTLKGMSVGAMVPVLELFAINAFEELEPLLANPGGGLLFLQRKEGYLRPPAPPFIERCSSFSVTGSGFTILAHNEHWLAGDLGLRKAAAVLYGLDVHELGPLLDPFQNLSAHYLLTGMRTP